MKKIHRLVLILIGVTIVGIGIFSRLEENKRVPIILCLGDSITYSDLGNYPFYLERLLHKNHIKARVYTIARIGDNSSKYLDFLEQCNLIGSYPRTLVLLMLGTNDVRVDKDRVPTEHFIKNMNEIIDIVIARSGMKGSPLPIFIARIPPFFKNSTDIYDRSSARRIEEEINPAIQSIASLRNLHLVDIHGIFVREPDLLFEIHPLRLGYKKIAEEFYASILPYLK